MNSTRLLLLSALTAFGCGGLPGSAPPVEMTTTNVRVVHLFADGHNPGAKVDVYRRYGPLHKEEATPVVSGLEYGQVSAFFHPYEGEGGISEFAFYKSGTHDRTTQPYAGFVFDQKMVAGDRHTINLIPSKDTGSSDFKPSWNIRREAPSGPNIYPPAANSTRARVMISDIAIFVYPNSGLWVGSNGMCLKYAESPSSEPDLLVTDKTVFDFDPGAVTVGLYPNPPSGPGDCSVTPTYGPATINGEAGKRYWLYLYGTSPTDNRTLVLPFGE